MMNVSLERFQVRNNNKESHHNPQAGQKGRPARPQGGVRSRTPVAVFLNNLTQQGCPLKRQGLYRAISNSMFSW